MFCYLLFFVFFSSRRRHTRCALVTGVQTCALPVCKSRQAAFFERGTERDGQGAPVTVRRTVERDRAIAAVTWPAEVTVRFQLSEVRQHVVAAPSDHAKPRPVVIIGDEATLGLHPVDRRTAPHHPGLKHRTPPPLGQIRPEKTRPDRSEEHTSELQSLMRNSSAD